MAGKPLSRVNPGSELIWLVARNIAANWSCALYVYKSAKNHFAMLYPARFARPRA